MKTLFILSLFFLSLFANENYYYSFGEKIQVTKLSKARAIDDNNITFYQTEHGHKVGVKHDVIIACKDKNQCKEILKKYNVLSIEQLSETLYLLNFPKDTNPFEISNQLYEEEAITLAHPNFIKERKSR